VTLAFDDLQGASRDYYYTLEHCDALWRSSNLTPAEYLQGFIEDRILDYNYSSGTVQKYTHYQISFPNEQIRPKLSGNYIVKVYENGDQSKLILTRRMYIVNSRVTIAADILYSQNVQLRQTNQKINFQLDMGTFPVQNPYSDFQVIIMQNRRPETAMLSTHPAYIRGPQLVYNDINTNDFPGRYEFRHFDTRTLKLNSDRIARIYRDTANTVILLGDPVRDQLNYTFEYDNNGSFFINNTDNSRNPNTDADYAHMYFSLAANKSNKEGSAFVVGQFNDFRLDDASRMDYDASKGRFYTDLLLKQGVYDYAYVWADTRTGKPDDTVIEGTHFETENEYQLLVYYRPVGARWDELVGFRQLNITKR
jgi:hypothetical protein